MRRIATLFVLTLTQMMNLSWGATIVSVGNASIPVGSSGTVVISVTDVSDLFGFQLDLSFDPGIVQANTVSEGALLATGGSTFFISGTIDNPAGTISFIANSLLGALPGVTGSGSLVNVEFQGLSAGTASLAISNLTLLDSALNSIPYSTLGASLVVQPGGGGVIPEPGTAAFFALGSALAAAGSLASRRRAN